MVGVYPSAWHVAWRAPAHLSSSSRRGHVAALAVDVEPTVFWDGDQADFLTRRAKWLAENRFVEGDDPGAHGWISPESPPANGSSGAKVEERYLRSLGVSTHDTAFTDVYPVFVVKKGSRAQGARREQADAIAQEYDEIAEKIGRQRSSLPARPGAKRLVGEALAGFAQRLLRDLEAANAPCVISLGDESLQVLRGIPELSPHPPADTITGLYGLQYGRPGHLSLNGRRVEWLALAHPGLLRGTAREVDVDPRHRTRPGWNWLHAQWVAGQPGNRP